METAVMWGQICNFVHGLKPVMIMVLAQVAFAGVNVFYKLAAYDGMSLKFIVAYRFIFASAIMVPLALIVERKSRPKLTWTVLFQAFLCGLFGGSLCQNLYVEGLALTSATQASAMMNLVPGFTFILALAFGLEKLGLRTMAGKAKVLGTVMGIGGAMLLTFYKGVQINFWSTNVDLLNGDHTHGSHVASSSKEVFGSIIAVASCISFALWLIIQAKMTEKYPCPYTSTALMSVMASVQAIVYGLCTEKDRSQWKLGWNIRLLTVAYSGIVASGLMVALMSWCVRLRGPLFVSIFSPIMLILVALAGYLVLDEKLYLGSVIGAVLIICGLYVVLWGKRKEMKKMTQLVPSMSSSESDTIEIVISSSTNDQKIIISNNKSNNKISEKIVTDSHEGKVDEEDDAIKHEKGEEATPRLTVEV